MKGIKAQRRRLAVAAVVLVMVIGGGFVAWRAVRGFVHRYFWESYAPAVLLAEDVGDYPPEHHLDDVPWIGSPVPACQSTALQMIAAQHDVEHPRPHLDFLMGFTYGAGRVPGAGFLPVGADPEVGFIVAAPYLGLERRYLIADDEALYLSALRSHLSRGDAVRVPLDMAVLYGWNGRMPHSEVLVGYDRGGFYYYETVCALHPSIRDATVPCEPGRRSPGELGLYVTDETLLRAVRGQTRLFFYPWRYALTLFEPGPLEQDLGPVWMRNGESLVGGQRYGMRWGAAAVEEWADTIGRRGVRMDAVRLRMALEMAALYRADNAAYLRETFGGEADVERAAALLERAVVGYRLAGQAAQDDIDDRAEAGQIATWVSDAAVAEREAGQIFVARGP